MEPPQTPHILPMQIVTRSKIQALAALFTILLSLAVTERARADKVTLIAGGTGGDGGQANQAQVTKPFGIIFDQDGNLYIGQFGTKTEGQLVRKVDTKGIITTLAGTGKVGAAGDGGPATAGEFNLIHDIVIGPDGSLY